MAGCLSRDEIRKACVEPPGPSQRREPGEPRPRALIRACSLGAKEIPAERGQAHGVCGRHGGTEERLTWGDLVAFPMNVFMPRLGPKNRREGRAIRPRRNARSMRSEKSGAS